MTDTLAQWLSRQRDPQRVREAAERIAVLCASPSLAGRSLNIMEVCGTHTVSVYRYGLKQLLPPNLSLISGPGCPVCVTPALLLEQALTLARDYGVIITSFGDMLRVPLGGDSLLKAREQGADVRLVTSPLEALNIALQEPMRQVVFLAVGFETTAPLTASTLQLAAEQNADNFSILCAHRTMPQALRALLGESTQINGLLIPGHVAAVTGADYFDFVAGGLGKPAVVAGFEPLDIMEALLKLVEQLAAGECRLENAYTQVVAQQANSSAWAALNQVFEPADALWRGLGMIPGSGLKLRKAYAAFDVCRRFDLADTRAQDNPACRCGEVLRGLLHPRECPLFGRVCSPDSPEGACMVSSEGACAAAYKYKSQSTNYKSQINNG